MCINNYRECLRETWFSFFFCLLFVAEKSEGEKYAKITERDINSANLDWALGFDFHCWRTQTRKTWDPNLEVLLI